MERLESRLLFSAVNTAGVSWSTYFGGSENEGADDPSDLAIDANGDKLMGGWTESSDLPDATNSYSGADVDGFVAKFDPSGNLLWSTYIGGSDTVEVSGVAVDSSGDAFVTGRADASDLPDALNSAFGGRDAFVAKLDPDGNILWSLYLGGSGDDQGQGIAVDGSGNAYITGWTQSSDFTGASGIYGGATDAFLAKVDSDGALQWATYFGESGLDKAGSVAVNSAGDSLVAGITGSNNLLEATNVYQGGSSDAFVAKFDASGSEQWVTYLGGSGSEAFLGGSTGYLGGVAWDSDGSAAVTGFTQSSNLPMARNKYNGGGDGFVSEVDASGQLLWSDYLGGGKTDVGTAVAFDSQHNIIVAGATNLTSLTANTMNVMVAKISPSGTVDFINQFGGSRNDDSGAIAVDTGGNVWITGGTWSSDFPAADNTSPPGDPSQGADEPYNAILAEIPASAMSQAAYLAGATPPKALPAGNLPALTVQLEFASGTVVNDDSAPVRVTLEGVTNATLGGTTTVNAINGVATFTDLQIDQAGTYTLNFSDAQDGLTAVSSGKFTVIADSASARLVLSPGTPAAVVGKAFSPAIGVEEVDEFGNLVTAESAKVTLGVAAGPTLTLGGTVVGALKNGAASFSKAVALAAGDYTLSLTSANQAVAPLEFIETVSKATTTVTLPHVSASYPYGQTIKLSAAFKSGAPSSIPFTGTATLSDAGDNFTAVGTLTSGGVVEFMLPVIPANAAPYAVTITYPGDADHTAITSAAFPLLIKPAASTTTLQVSAASLGQGQSLTLTASVGPAVSGSAGPTGNAVFMDNGVAFGTMTLSGGSASTMFVPAGGAHKYSVDYSGDTNFSGGVTSAKQAVKVSPSVDLLTLMGFNSPGSTWNYNVSAASGGSSATGMATATTTADFDAEWDWTSEGATAGDDGEPFSEDLTWEQTDTGVDLDAIQETSGNGYSYRGETITFDNPEIGGLTLVGKTSTKSLISIDATGVPDGLNGTATITTTLAGTSSVTVPSGTYLATEVTIAIAFKASGSVDTGNGTANVTVQGTDTLELYGVSGVGMVKVVSDSAEKETETGFGTGNINAVNTSVLTSYDYLGT